MTKMATMPIYGKNPSNIFFSETNRLISMKLGVKHPWLKYYNVYINHDPVMTLTKFMARSTWVAHAFEWEKLLKCHLKGKASKKLANGQTIDYSEKKKTAQGLHLPHALGLNTIIFKHVYWYMQQTQVSVYRTIGPLVFWNFKSFKVAHSRGKSNGTSCAVHSVMHFMQIPAVNPVY